MMEQISRLVQFFIQRNLTLLIVILVVLLVRLLMQRMPKRYVYCLWAIVGIRMLFSFQVVSPVSVYQLFPWADPQAVSFRIVAEDAGLKTAQDTSKDLTANQQVLGNDFASQYAGASVDGQKAENGSAGEADLPEGDVQAALRGDAPEDGEGQRSGRASLAEGIGSKAADGQDLPAGQGTRNAGDALAPATEEDPSGLQQLAEGDRTGLGQFAESDVHGAQQSGESDLTGSQFAKKDLQGLPQGAEGMAPTLIDRTARNVFVILFFAIWIAGLIAVLGIGMLSYLRIRRLVKEAVHLEDNVWECDGIATPFVLGIVKPRIFIPFHLEEEKRLLVLEHERQHLRRLDPLARLLAYVLLAVYWINPLVWLSYFCFVRDQEMRCDEAVLSRLGAEHKKEYGMTLLSFATQERFVGFSPVAFGESDAEKRIKNVLNYKKPDFWIILVCVITLVCIGIICLTEAKKSKDAKDGTDTEQTKAVEGTDGTDETKQGGEPVEEKILYQSTVSADLDGDGEKEVIWINDYILGKTTLNTKIGGKAIKEHTMQSVQMIKTDCVAADLTGDGKEELITLQSSPMLASTYNWPGKVTILQVKDGEWREFSDALFYPQAGEYVYQDYYPKKISESICINVKVEPTEDGAILHLTYPLSYELAHGMDGVLRIDCTYREAPEEGFEVCYYFVSHDYVSLQSRTSVVHGLYSISVGYEPGETSAVEQKVADKLFSEVPFQHYFEGWTENEALTLNMGEDGTFTGVDVTNGGPQTRICEYAGKVTNLRMVNTLQYVFTVEELSYPAPDQITQQDRTQLVTAKPFGMEEGDRFLLYLPGYPVTSLPSVVIRGLEDAGRPNWYNYHLEELPCFVLYNLERGTVYLSGYLDEFVGQRMETIGLYGELSYPCGPNGGFPIQTVTQLCADACGVFVQKVKNPLAQSQSFMAFVRSPQLADYLEYKTKHFLYQLKDGRWRLEIKQFQEVTVSGARVLHVTGIPKYYAVSEGTLSTLHVLNSYGNVARGSWGTIHFLIDHEDGQLYIRDWYWDHMDSGDVALRGEYSVEEAYHFWDSYEAQGYWKEAYLEYVRRIDADAFALVYLDDDEIPEVYCEINGYADRIVACHNGMIRERDLQRYGLFYREREGIYLTEGGNNGEFPLEIVQLKEGEFTVLASGWTKSEYIANAESTDPDQLTYFETYDWNGHSVTKDEYYRSIDAIIERKTAIHPETLYAKEEVLTQLGEKLRSLNN